MQCEHSIIGSLAGTSYFGPVAGHGIATHDLDLIRMERAKHQVERTGMVGGDIEATNAPDDADFYVMIKKKNSEKGEGEDGEGQGENEGEGEGKDEKSGDSE